MAVVKMQKLSVCASKQNRKAVLELLQRLGIMEIRTEEMDIPGLVRLDTAEQCSRFERAAENLEQAAGILGAYAPEKKKGQGLFAERTVIGRDRFASVLKEGKQYLCHAKEILAAEKEIEDCKGRIAGAEDLQLRLAPWKDLGMPLSGVQTKETCFIPGMIPGEWTKEALIRIASGTEEAPHPAEIFILREENRMTYLVCLCFRKDAEETEEALREKGFVRFAGETSGDPAEEGKRAAEEIRRMREKIADMQQQIRQYGEEDEAYRILSDAYRTRAEKYRLLGTVPQSESVFFLEGWVPADQADRLTRLLEEECGALVEPEEPEKGEIEPTLLKNNRFSENVEGILESYGLPQHGRIDPTAVMSVFYVFFFGMMLSDAAYGLLMSILCGIVLWKHRHLESGLQKMLRLFFWCGLSTAFWGFMYGSFFGDAPTVIAETFFGYTGTAPILAPIWFEPLTDPMRLLLFCMLFGVIHLFTGLALKGWEAIREGDYVGFVSDICAWFVFLIGLLLMLIPSALFSSIAGMTITLPGWLSDAAPVMAGAGAAVILLMSGRRKRNWGLRIALGLYDIYGVTSWLSDVLSYSRLLALGLATGAIASVINMMAGMVAGIFGGVLGGIVFVVIFLLGHTLNIGINLLGAYVHTNRLQYVEFFGKFYDAGGEPFRPFRTQNRYTEIKEERRS